MVCSSDSVRSQESNDFGRAEGSSVFEAGENLGHGVEGLRHSQVRSGVGCILPAQKELKTGSARAVRDTDRSRKLDEVGDGDLGVSGNERLLLADNLVSTKIGVEVRLNVAEDNEGAVCASTAR